MATETVTAPATPTARRFTWTPGLVIGLALMAAVVATGVLAPMLLAERATELGDSAAQPSAAHWAGTDAAGHDMLARSLVATRLTLLMTIGATALSVVGGLVIGTAVWLAPRRPRTLGLRAIDALVAFPTLLLALVVAAILEPGTRSAIVAIGLAGIPYFARLTANLAAQISRRDFVGTARLMGVPGHRIATRHILPNMAEPLLVLTASAFAQALTALSALSFVGLGVQSPDYDYGKLLNEALPSLLAGRPWQMAAPTLLIVLTGVAATLIGDGLAAAADPRTGARNHTATLTRAGTPRDPEDATALVEVDDLVITDATGRALVDHVSLRIAPGEIVGLVGESGSGKSLTAMTLARLLPDGLTAGATRLRLGDLDLLGRVAPRDLALAMGLVYQDPGTTFNPALRLGTQLTEVLRTHARADRDEARARILDALRAVRMTKPELRLRQHPHELSGGMRQRAMIASAIATTPKLLIADEPTTALDVTVQAEILRELKRINREFGTAILFISHDLAVVRALCDRVLVMTEGRIVEQTTAANLTTESAEHPYTRRLLAATPTVATVTASTAGESAP
ncbi:dipeptide/oligopeptide/nickel ABC transporter permease/ATP-binding protein [Streptomyces mayteni]